MEMKAKSGSDHRRGQKDVRTENPQSDDFRWKKNGKRRKRDNRHLSTEKALNDDRKVAVDNSHAHGVPPVSKKRRHTGSEDNATLKAVTNGDTNGGKGFDKQLRATRKQMQREKAKLKKLENSAAQIGDSSIEVLERKRENSKKTSKHLRTLERNSKRVRHEMEREHADVMIRTSPNEFLWSEYTKWMKMNGNDTDEGQQWTPDQVHVVLDDGEESFIPHVKKIIGADYLSKHEFKKSKKSVPGVAIIALAVSAVRAVKLAPRFFDGQPVGKLFSKHIAIEEQKKRLIRSCRTGLAASAVGTAKRVDKLIEEGSMTLKHTKALILDFARDSRLRNMFDFPTTRNEVLQFLHSYGTKEMQNEMKVILMIPDKQPVRIEDLPESSSK